MQAAGLNTFPHISLLECPTLKRTDTPSTDCGDESSHFHDLLSRTYIDTQSPYSVSRRRSKGLTSEQLRAAVRKPFRFPFIPTSTTSPTPICTICRSQFYGGEECRELTSCGHCFHSGCIEDYFKAHSRCPVCRCRYRHSTKSRKQKQQRPCWTPEYDEELLCISDKLDRERRQKQFLLKGCRDSTPQSYVFLKSTLPTLIEEPTEEVLRTDDGSLVSLCRHIYREKEVRRLVHVYQWTTDMKRLGITFLYSLCCMYACQWLFVDLYIKRKKYFFPHTEETAPPREGSPL